MKWLLAVLVGIVVGVALSQRPEPRRPRLARLPLVETGPWADPGFWRDLERVDSV